MHHTRRPATFLADVYPPQMVNGLKSGVDANVNAGNRAEVVGVFHRILVAIDGSKHAQRALDQAIDLASLANAKLTVIGVRQRTSTLLVGGPVVPPVDFGELEIALQRDYEQLLEQALEQVPQDLSVATVLAEGAPAPAILAQARKDDSDLIVLGSRGRGGMASMLLGSVSHQVLQRSGVPVLVVHVEDDEQAAG